jgi:hypothetical protein
MLQPGLLRGTIKDRNVVVLPLTFTHEHPLLLESFFIATDVIAPGRRSEKGFTTSVAGLEKPAPARTRRNPRILENL